VPGEAAVAGDDDAIVEKRGGDGEAVGRDDNLLIALCRLT